MSSYLYDIAACYRICKSRHVTPRFHDNITIRKHIPPKHDVWGLWRSNFWFMTSCVNMRLPGTFLVHGSSHIERHLQALLMHAELLNCSYCGYFLICIHINQSPTIKLSFIEIDSIGNVSFVFWFQWWKDLLIIVFACFVVLCVNVARHIYGCTTKNGDVVYVK